MRGRGGMVLGDHCWAASELLLFLRCPDEMRNANEVRIPAVELFCALSDVHVQKRKERYVNLQFARFSSFSSPLFITYEVHLIHGLTAQRHRRWDRKDALRGNFTTWKLAVCGISKAPILSSCLLHISSLSLSLYSLLHFYPTLSSPCVLSYISVLCLHQIFSSFSSLLFSLLYSFFSLNK